ncbi:hypothetical protein M3223_20370 [Paenibacillus pasadenensis]|uniref:hypothetical protein n=1 Tax=Paenibacillus pasadenensis TaxID=217090 RepID=UPI00203D775E|nr:hypothetical protein [Paenibacillus pasadenensis]MCM3749711.1 hypothetical protein [Paenibacillus pasadenensis]
MKKLVLLLTMFLVFFSTFPSSQVYALSCEEIPSKERAYQKYDGIIVGVVEKIDSNFIFKNESSRKVKLTVKQSYKGVRERTITIDEDPSWGRLIESGSIGKEYLVFLKRENEKWINPLCSPTRPVAEAKEELAYWKEKKLMLPDKSVDKKAIPSITGTIIGITAFIVTSVLIALSIRKKRKPAK